MEDKFISSIIAIAGILVSSLISYFISRRNARIEYEKIKKQFTQRIFEKRLEVYPSMYYLLSNFQKTIKSRKATKENLKTFYEEFQEQDSKSAIYMSPTTVVELYMLKSYIKDLDWDNPEYLKKLTSQMIRLENALKTELGIFDVSEYHNPEAINQKTNELITQRKEAESQHKQLNS